MKLQIDRPFLTGILQDLVRINSVNPSLSPAGQGEAEIARYVGEALTNIGLDATLDEVQPGRMNVTGRLPGTGGGRSLVLNAHLDTVDVAGMEPPFSGDIRDGRLYGRGAQDMKGSLAAMIAAAKALAGARIPLRGDLLISGVADEEYASIGAADFVERCHADAAIVTEPTDLHVCLAHKGFVWYEVETNGRAAHGSRFEEGIDANLMMGRFLAGLGKLEKELRSRPGHPLVGPPSLHAARIEGGSEWSVYAARCRLQIERRTIPGESESQSRREIQAILDRLAGDDPGFNASLRTSFQRAPFEVAPGVPIVQALDRAAEERLGSRLPHSGQTFWTDAAIFAAAGIDTVLIGPTGGGLHSADEWVDLDSVVELAYILAETARIFCG